jgi:NTE family protein
MIHSIKDEASIAPMGSVSKLLIEPAYLEHLFQLGRVAAAKWLAATFESVGMRSSVDIRARFLD